ncbi:hypothetical protein [Micromonospora sp. NPDC000729]|uniref:hypothetical protein n=1 Tax=Micromonospora sp. NPDC000729 TaxID=3364220 RepID=UPI0036CA62B3
MERSDIAGLFERFDELRTQGRGYVEVRAGDVFPVLTLGFTESAAVVHLMTDESTMSLLAADEPASMNAQVLIRQPPFEMSLVGPGRRGAATA